MSELNYNMNNANNFLPSIKKGLDEVQKLLREKMSAENAEKAAERASDEIVKRAVKGKPIKANSTEIIAGINQIIAGMNSRANTNIPSKENKSKTTSENIFQDKSAGTGSSAAVNVTSGNNVNGVVDRSGEATTFENLVAGWDSFIAGLPQDEPDAYNEKIAKLNEIIAAGEAALVSFPNGVPEAPSAGEQPSEEYTQYQELSQQVNIWRCRRFTMIQNYATALLQDYNQQLNADTAEFTNWPFNDGGITLHVNGQDFDLRGTAFLHLHENGQNFISLTDFWHNNFAGNTSINNTCCSDEDCLAVNGFHGKILTPGGTDDYIMGSYGRGVYKVNEDPVQEFFYSQAMIAYYRAQVQAIRAKLNDPMLDGAQPGSTLYNQAQNMRGWIARAESEIARHTRIINQYCVGEKGLDLEEYAIQGLEPATQTPPNEMSPGDLQAYYDELSNKYDTLLGKGSNDEIINVLSSLIYVAEQLDKADEAERWQALLDELTGGSRQAGNDKNPFNRTSEPKEEPFNIFSSASAPAAPEVQPKEELPVPPKNPEKPQNRKTRDGGIQGVNLRSGGDEEENPAGGGNFTEEIVTNDDLPTNISDLDYPHDNHYQALQIPTDQEELMEYYNGLIEKFYAKGYDNAPVEPPYDYVLHPTGYEPHIDHSHNSVRINDVDGEYVQLLKLLILAARGMGSTSASGYWEKLLSQAQQHNNFGFI